MLSLNVKLFSDKDIIITQMFIETVGHDFF